MSKWTFLPVWTFLELLNCFLNNLRVTTIALNPIVNIYTMAIDRDSKDILNARKDILNVNVTYEMIAIPIHWYSWQLVYSHGVFYTIESFHFLGTDKKVPPVLLWIEIALLNKYFNQNIEINNLYMDLIVKALLSD